MNRASVLLSSPVTRSCFQAADGQMLAVTHDIDSLLAYSIANEYKTHQTDDA